MAAERPAAVVFDLDGTLVESRRAIARSMNHARVRLGHPELPVAEVARHIGWGLDHTLGALFPDDQIDDARARYRAHYARTSVETSEVLPGVERLLRRLAAVGIRRAVATNKPARFARPLLDGLGLGHLLEEVVGAGDAELKPSPELLELALERLGVAPERALYVGDMDVDRRAAAAAGIPFVAIASGAWSEAELRAAGADRVVASFSELNPLLGL